MAEGNGVDLGHLAQMLQSVIVAQEQARVEMAAMRTELKAEIAEVKTDVRALRAEVNSDLQTLRADVRDYHHAVVGHGITLTEHDDRLARLERHAGLPPAA